MAPAAREKGLEISWSAAAGVPELSSGDEARMRQVLLNLLSNAVKFTDQGHVQVSVQVRDAETDRGEDMISLSVADSGIGVTDGEKQMLFAEFEQGDPAVHRQHGGTGLGLAISRRLTRAMDGDISVTSAPG